ncbi:2Fe-2S iron-sulfur cluster-binding protein, partial [Cupriavidus basilensis]|uniref:2Fe-2S iron-sulfur cluster-binding protein n=1 Tax=Cupriavidus basilensis TaxID=68895 RepID=UPI00114695D5
MTFNVTLHPSGHSYEVPDGVTVLTAGLEAGWIMPYSCRAGGCRTCQGRILGGQGGLWPCTCGLSLRGPAPPKVTPCYAR